MENKIRKLKQLIEENGDQICSLKALCRQAGVDYYVIRKPFRREVGMSLFKYYQQHRQSKAETYLAMPELKIREVSDKMGYSNVPGFTHWFKKRTGRSPKAFRQDILRIGRERENGR